MPETWAERFVAEWRGNKYAKLALWVPYDEETVEALRDLDWDTAHAQVTDDYRWRDGQLRDGTRTMDSSREVARLLRSEAGINILPLDSVAWNVDIYETSPGSNPRQCEGCREERVLGARGVAAVQVNDYRRDVLESNNAAEQVCMECGQFYRYVVREEVAGGPVRVTENTAAHEVM